MKSKKLIEVIKAKDLVIPSILLANYKELNINEKTFNANIVFVVEL